MYIHAYTNEAASLLSGLEGLAFGDKGYIGKNLFKKLIENRLKLIIKKRKKVFIPIMKSRCLTNVA